MSRTRARIVLLVVLLTRWTRPRSLRQPSEMDRIGSVEMCVVAGSGQSHFCPKVRCRCTALAAAVPRCRRGLRSLASDSLSRLGLGTGVRGFVTPHASLTLTGRVSMIELLHNAQWEVLLYKYRVRVY